MPVALLGVPEAFAEFLREHRSDPVPAAGSGG